MQLHNILIIDYPGLSPAVQPSQDDSIIQMTGDSITTRLTDYLSSSQIDRGTGINLILDQAFIRYQHFSFPKIATRRLRQMLPFELDDALLKGAENYLYTYDFEPDKKAETTAAGVYIIEKQLLDELLSIFKLFNLELRWLTSVENLMDLAYRETAPKPESEIRIDLDENQASARFFTYRNGFLTGVSAMTGGWNAPGEPMSPDHDLADQLNQVVNAIRLSEPDLSRLSVSGNSGTRISISEDRFVKATDESLTRTDASRIDNLQVRLDHPRRINLIQSNFLFVQELKKHSRSLAIIAGILLISLALYIGFVTYRGYSDHVALLSLDQRLTQTISRYLPANTSKSNAVYVLKERIRNLETERNKQHAFEQRRYQVAKTLTGLSLLKEEVPSLTLDRFSLNDQIIRFQGRTASLNDFDLLQEGILKLFPENEFRINTNEKSLTDGGIEFSATVQEKSK